MMIGTISSGRSSLQLTQAKALCGRLTRPQVTQLDDNIYVRRGNANSGALIVWSPAEGRNCTAEFTSLDGLRQAHPEFEAHSRYLDDYYGAVFRSPELDNFELARGLSEWSAENSLPAEVRQLLGWSPADSRTPGAYPFRP